MGTDTWQGNNDNWDASPTTDWSEGTVPGLTDDVVIPNGDPQIVDNVGKVNSVTVQDNLSLKAGTLQTTGAFDVSGPGAFIDSFNTSGSTLNVGGTLTVGGTSVLMAGNLNQTANDVITANSFDIQTAGGFVGEVDLSGSSSGAYQTSLSVVGPAGFGTTGVLSGHLDMTGDSRLIFDSGSIMTVDKGATLSLHDANAQINDKNMAGSNSALQGFAQNNGNTLLDGGASVATNGDFTNGATGTFNVGGAGGGGGSTFAVMGTLTNQNQLNIGSGFFTEAGNAVTASALVNTGAVNLQELSTSGIASLVVGGDTTGAGSFSLSGNSSVEFGGACDNSVVFSSNATDNTLKLDEAGRFTGAITSFAAGDTLDLANENATILSYDGTTLTVTTAGGVTQTFALSGPMANGLRATSDGQNGTDILVKCFASGTLIRTSRGDVAVEDLVVGDHVVTASGAPRPIRWLGHRVIDCAGRARPSDAWPVRIRAHAFGAGPERDLYLSPGHPVLVGADEHGEGGCLVPIMCLINGTSIARVAVDAVTYWHVELDAHDILLAEGLPAESYLDWGDRGFFTEGSDHALANPDFVVPGLAGRCRPVAIDGPRVEAERRRLDALFVTQLAVACAWPDRISVDSFAGEGLSLRPPGLYRW